MTDTSQREIVAGPSREELFDALRLRHEGRMVTFTVAPSHITGRTLAGGRKFVPGNLTFEVRVNQLTGNGNCNESFWEFRLFDKHATFGSMYLEGLIDITTRSGWLRPLTD